MAKLTGMDAAYATRLQALLAEWVSRLDDLRALALCGWASIDPIDAGTRRVVSDGFTILIDKDNTLGALLAASKL